jgi:hypothetical protein
MGSIIISIPALQYRGPEKETNLHYNYQQMGLVFLIFHCYFIFFILISYYYLI